MRAAFLSLAGLIGLAAAAPATSLEARANCPTTLGNAGIFSSPCSTYVSALTCPNGIQGKKNGAVLLVHGTGSTGAETWGDGPYLKLLPDEDFDVCYVDLPNRSIGDIQTSSEYVAHLIPYLAARSVTGKVGLVTHSQGGLNAQWALDFWPQGRMLVSSFVAIAPPFHGTYLANPTCLVLGLVTGGCNPSVIQQSVGSNFLKALNARGGNAFVPTTSIFTAYDDIVRPQLIDSTSKLGGSKNIKVQDFCGAAYLNEHFGIPFAAYPYYLALDALKNKATADTSRVLKTSCAWVLDDYLLADFERGPAILSEIVHDALAVVTGEKSKSEPALKSYVCKRGDVSC
ncbi:hypothetical protein JCM10207_004117 [Rhodosporidiobolus poonsookiae]